MFSNRRRTIKIKAFSLLSSKIFIRIFVRIRYTFIIVRILNIEFYYRGKNFDFVHFTTLSLIQLYCSLLY